MTARVKVFAGPVGGGKTDRLLSNYREALASQPPGSALWLAPTHRAAEEVTARLLEQDLDCCLQPGVKTFSRFAEEVVLSSAELVRPVNRLMKRRLIARLIQRLHNEDKLQHFGSIAHTNGLLDLITEMITELKRLEIWPEDWEEAWDRLGGMRTKDRELWLIYHEYQEILNRRQLYDLEGVYWLARRSLQEESSSRSRRPRLIVVDGFSDFTRTHLKILRLLNQGGAELQVSLLVDFEPGREELFAKTQGVLKQLETLFPDQIDVERMPRPVESEWPALAHLEQELFKNPRLHRESPSADRIELIEASRELDELTWIARRIKGLLIDGDPASGGPVPPGEIAVVFRSLSSAADLVRETFAEMGIPHAVDLGQTLDASPALTRLVGWLQVALDDWPLRSLLAMITSNYFQPDWQGGSSREAALSAERVLHHLGVPRGRNALLRRVERLIEREGRRVAAEESQSGEVSEHNRRLLRDAETSLALFQEVVRLFALLPRRATYQEWSHALAKLADESGATRAMEAASDATAEFGQVNRQAWLQLRIGLASLAQLDEYLGEEPTQLSLGEFVAQLSDMIRNEQLETQEDVAGRVRVMSATAARGLRIPYLFCAGLSEESFPRPDRQDRVYTESETRELNEAGLDLAHRRQRNQEEMLLFLETLTAASKRLWLSFPGLDEKAQPLLPSPYLLEVELACRPRLERTVVQDLRPIPDDPRDANTQPVSAAGWRTAAVAEALRNGKQPLRWLVGYGRTPSHALCWNNILAGLRLTGDRMRREGFGRYEGMLLGDAARGRLADAFADTIWSPAALETFMMCPFRFFSQRVLRLEAPEDLDLATDYAGRGSLIHDALARMHRRINEEAKEPITPCDYERETLQSYFEEAVEQSIVRPDRDDALASALLELERRRMTEWETLYLDQHQSYDASKDSSAAGIRPAYFEVAFGLSREEELPADHQLSTVEPLVLSRADEQVKIGGRIDRVDVGEIGG
ncbi:MAG: exodeoxyribonuclease V subunit gamma, partial [Planctomycetales bacterium]